MQFLSLYSYNFRNLAAGTLATPALINVFYGANAQGKTNLLEAFYYAACGLSHRTKNEEELIRLGCKEMAVALDYRLEGSSHQLKLKRYAEQPASRGRKEISLDGAKIPPRLHYRASSVVLFAPEDLSMVKGEPALRRRYLDMQLSQTDPLYLDLLLRYNKVLQQRNKLLKELREAALPPSLLQPWDEEFCRLAAALVEKRVAAVAKLRDLAAAIYASLAGNGEALELSYQARVDREDFTTVRKGWEAEDYASLLGKRQQEDIARGSTGLGPHRDELLLALGGALSLRSFGSQGQQRSCALALKLAQLEYSREERGDYPVLLLDDVMSELDSQRREHLLRFIDGRVQTFITVNDRELIPELAGSAFFQIRDGQVEAV